MSEPRTYLIDAVVAVTVADDGTVTYDVDTAEASTAVRDLADASDLEVTVEQVDADADAIDADHARRNPETTLDTASPASRQHFIDTGRYLTHAEAVECSGYGSDEPDAATLADADHALTVQQQEDRA